ARYRDEDVPLIVIAGKEYGTGSSRDWAAKGPLLLGVRAVIAESFERIHRTNLVGMGILPLEFLPGQNLASLELTGRESYSVRGVETLAPRAGRRGAVRSRARGARVGVARRPAQGRRRKWKAAAGAEAPMELAYSRNGGILPAV